MVCLSVANKDVYIIYCLLFTYSALSSLSVTYLPPRGATVHALNRKSVKNKEFPVPLYWASLVATLTWGPLDPKKHATCSFPNGLKRVNYQQLHRAGKLDGIR